MGESYYLTFMLHPPAGGPPCGRVVQVRCTANGMAMHHAALLNQIIVVLYRPQDIVNIGGTVRAMKNMGVRHLRLVAPVPFVPADVERIAHRSADILATTQSYAALDVALADVHFVVGTTEHTHGQHPMHTAIRPFAQEIVDHAICGSVALLFGPEDNGLDMAALDRCHALVRLPTDPAYPSLNLAQAVLLLLYEVRMAIDSRGSTEVQTGAVLPLPAPYTQVEELFTVWEQALEAIQFFKTPHRQRIMRILRGIIHRATPDEREVALLRAIAREIGYALRHRE